MGIRQGCGIPQLFNAFIGGTLRKMEVRVLERCVNLVKDGELWTFQWLMYVDDDTVLIAENEERNGCGGGKCFWGV